MKKFVIFLIVIVLTLAFASPAFAYTVTVTAEPADGGDVTVNDMPGGGDISEGTNAVVKAVPKDGYIFAGWFREDGSAVDESGSEFTYTLEEDRTYVARFEKKYTFALNASPQEGGTVSQSGTEYMLNDSVTVTAAPAENYNFIGWFADPSSEEPISTELEYTFTVSADTPATLTAKFAATYQLDVSVSPEGTGTVVGTGAYPGGSVVTVGASPAQDWRFSGWYDADLPGKIISSDPEYSFNLDENRALVALFERSYTYIFMWVLIWIGICFAVFVVVMRTIRHFRIVRRRRRRRPRRY